MMIRTIGLVMVVGTVMLAACGDADSANFVPAGMAHGQPTFLYLFTEN